MSNVKAPPLGQLDSGTIDDLLDSVDLPSPTITPAKELVFTRPGTAPLKAPTNIPAPPPTTPQPTTPPAYPYLQSLSTQSMSDSTVGDLTESLAAGSESTPFTYTGRRAGTNLDQGVRVDPSAVLPRVQTDIGTFVNNPLNTPGSSDAVIANGTPVNQFQYTEGLTASQQNTRDFFNGLQDFRKQIAPSMLPALLYTPQQLDPSLAGGFAPTAETKGPWSWLVGDPTEDINPLKGDFGASGQGLLGGVGWLFGRLSPTTYLKGVAMDVARSVAAGYEGGSAGLEALLKGGDFGDAFVSAASENFYANAPQARGLPVKTIFGNRDVGDFFTQSYTLSAVSGANDTSFSGQGNNTLFTDGGNRNIVNKGESFNPFGARDPFRSSFNTGKLEERERSKGSWFGHGYDQAGMFGVGLVADIFLEGRIDKVATKAVGAATKGVANTTTQVTRNSDELQRGINALRNQPPVPNPSQLKLPPAREPLPDLSAFTTPAKPDKGGALVTQGTTKKTKVYRGEFVPSAQDVTADTARRLAADRPRLQPIEQRYLPPGRDPFVIPETPRAYSPKNTDLADVTFESGGAIVPYSVKQGLGIDTSEGGKIVPAILGVGGKPGGIPTTPRIEDGRVFIAKGAEPVTVWDPKSNQFISSGNGSTLTVERSMKAPGKVDLPNTPTPKETPLLEPSSGLRGDVQFGPGANFNRLKQDVPELVNDVFVPVAKFKTPGAWKRIQEAGTPSTPAKKKRTPISSRSVWKAQKALEELPNLVPANTPNFTIKPTLDNLDDIPDDFLADPTTGVLRQNYNTPAKTRIGETFTPPPPQVTSVAAEVLTPSASSADTVRNLLNDTVSTTYNPTLLAKEPRDISSMTVLAQTVMLPGGVRILDEVSAKDVKSFHQLNKVVESAIISAGLNPSSPEVSGIRRMFDRVGPSVPNKLDGGFVVEVAPRTLDTPTSYVKPSQASSLLDDGWSPRANTSTPAKTEYVLGVNKSDGVNVPLTKDNLLSVPVNERKLLVGKSVSDGYQVPTGAVRDATSPDIVKDVQAAKDYAKANLPKESVPSKLDLETRTALKEHQQTTQELMYTNDVITDVSTQLTDVEIQLSKYLKKVDELPDIGVYPLVDKVPASPLTKDIVSPKLYDAEDVFVNGETVRNVSDTVPFGVIGDDGVTLNLAAGKLGNGPRPDVTILTKEQLPDALSQVDEFTSDFTGVLNGKAAKPPRMLDVDSLDATVMPDIPDSDIVSMFKQGTFMTPVVKMTGGTEVDPVFTVLSGERYVSAYKRAKHLDTSHVDRMYVRIVDDGPDSLVYGTSVKLMDAYAKKGTNYIYHSTVGDELRFVGKDNLTDYTTLSKSDFDDYVERGLLVVDSTTPPVKPSYTPDSTGYTPNATEFTINGKNDPIAFSNSGIAKNKGEVYQYLGKTDDGMLAVVGKNDPYSYRLLDESDLDDYIKQGVVSTAANKDAPYKLYHGTRVDKLDLASVDPVMGATRSEYGTGVWLTRDQSIATAASGRAVPNNTVPLDGREFSDLPTIHELDSSVLSAMNIVKSTDTVSPNVLKEMPLDGRLFSDIVSYGDDLTEGLVDLLGTSKTTYGELFDKVDDLVRSTALKNTGSTADEYELTYVQRVVTDMLRNRGVDGVTNETNTVIYRTNNLLTDKVHNVSDLVGDNSNSVNLALHEVNLLQKSLDAEPGSKLLQVQLAEAKAVAASRVRDSLADELSQLTGEQTKLISKLMKQDDTISDIAKTQRSQDLIGATVKDENTFDAFTKELNKTWDTPCL